MQEHSPGEATVSGITAKAYEVDLTNFLKAEKAAGRTAVTLVLLKVVAGAVTGSLSLFASAVDSLMDIFASLVNFVAVRTASRPISATSPPLS